MYLFVRCQFAQGSPISQLVIHRPDNSICGEVRALQISLILSARGSFIVLKKPASQWQF